MKLRKIILALGVIVLAYLIFFTGPRASTQYPNNKTSPYSLPWQPNTTHLVTQGNRGFLNHRGIYEFSWDFFMPVGTEILAARGGKVLEAVDNFDGEGNRIVIEHQDGTKGVYEPIKKGGSLVHPGEEISRSHSIGYSGMVGPIIIPHIHFHVVSLDGSKTIPISFHEVVGGIPLGGKIYTSLNDGH